MAKKKYIALPKPYISYSQLSQWQRDPRQYKDIYFDNRDELRTTNAGMAYGKVVADALEHGVETDDLLTDAAMLLLPKYDIADVEMRVDMKTKDGWITLLAKPDSLDSKTKAFMEYKTGKVAWTQAKAQGHLQMHFYATAIYLAHKVIPDCKLVWIETEWIDGIVKPTGHVEEFTVTLTMKDILACMALISRTAKAIEIAYAAHVPNKELLEY